MLYVNVSTEFLYYSSIERVFYKFNLQYSTVSLNMNE